MTAALIIPFEAFTEDDVGRVGGKGANLGRLARGGFAVPPGFCVSTLAFESFIQAVPGLENLFQKLDALDGRDPDAARRVAEATRDTLGQLPIPEAVQTAVLDTWQQLDAGEGLAWAVRSSSGTPRERHAGPLWDRVAVLRALAVRIVVSLGLPPLAGRSGAVDWRSGTKAFGLVRTRRFSRRRFADSGPP